MKRRTFISSTGYAGLFVLLHPSQVFQSFSQFSEPNLEQAFQNPSPSVYPAVIWFWMNGNVTKEEITLDLEAMKAVGISGVYNFDAGTGIPQGPVAYLSDEWVQLKKHAVAEAQRLGLRFTMHNCPGWSASGGPWITPELAMQEVTWSESFVIGGNERVVTLPIPRHKLNCYKDIAVLAFPSLQGEAPLSTLVTNVTSSSGVILKKEFISDDATGVAVWPSEGSSVAWLQLEFHEPYEARFIDFFISAVPAEASPNKTEDVHDKTSVDLEASDDGIHFRLITTINTGSASGLTTGQKFITYDIPASKAKYFRLTSQAARQYSKIRFSGVARLKNFMEKAGYRFMFSGDGLSPTTTDYNDEVPQDSIIDAATIINISSFMNKDGELKWNAPAGNWTILRMGFTPVGTLNRAAPDNGTGLECDKFSQKAFDVHFNNIMTYLHPIMEPLMKSGNVGLEIDSYEAGMQNWTPEFPEAFQKRRQYDLRSYLPTLTGRVVNSTDVTERFLWDFRRTHADLVADNYYGRFAELCFQYGFTSYIQPYDRGPFNEMQVGAKVDVNLGEFWYGLFSVLQNNFSIRRTPRLVASIAHTNGQRIVGAEAFTSEPDSSAWQEYPFAMKEVGDKAFTQGINMMVIHRYVHQPHPSAVPGMTLGPYGIHFERTNTWWNESKVWLRYLARCQSLLQHGIPVVDLAYVTTDDANLYTKVNPDELIPVPPKGYSYDLITSETILRNVTVKDGRIVLPNGTKYTVLVLQNCKAITLELLHRLRDLVEQGMVLVGAKPERSLGLGNYVDKDASFNQVTNELWGTTNKGNVVEQRLGKGCVYWGRPLQDILKSLAVKPDFQSSSQSGNAPIRYTHRTIANTHIYFIANSRRTFEDITCTFRVQKMQPELWNAETGEITPLSLYEIIEDVVRMPLQLEPYGSMFVIFRSPPPVEPYHMAIKDEKIVLTTTPFPPSKHESYKNITNSFTIFFWAKPEMNIMLNTSPFMGDIKDPWTDYYAVYPTAGKELYGKGHAVCGVTVGRNGVGVWENSSGNPILILAAPIMICGWSAITLVYRDGVPAIYVNGTLVKEGKQSSHTIHPDMGEGEWKEGVSYYNGDLTKPQLFEDVLSEEKIQQLAKRAPRGLQAEPLITTTSLNNKPAFLVWQNGAFRLQPKSGKPFSFHVSDIPKPIYLKGAWQVHFPPNLGAPPSILLPELMSLHKHANDGVKYFSGTATYVKSFMIPGKSLGYNSRLFLDLGRVEVIGNVFVNGKDLGTLWKRPYKVDITNASKVGINQLHIKVVNLWPNRLIGDAHLADPDQFILEGYQGSSEYTMEGGIQKLPQWYLHGMPKPNSGRITFTTWKHYTKESPLLESGLIGPVVVQTAILKQV